MNDSQTDEDAVIPSVNNIIHVVTKELRKSTFRCYHRVACKNFYELIQHTLMDT